MDYSKEQALAQKAWDEWHKAAKRQKEYDETIGNIWQAFDDAMKACKKAGMRDISIRGGIQRGYDDPPDFGMEVFIKFPADDQA